MNNSLAFKKLLIVLGVISMSTSAVFVNLATAPSLVLVFYRLAFAAMILTVPGILALKKEIKNIDKTDILLCLLAGFFMAIHFATYFESLKHTSIASAMVLVDTEVFFVAFIMLFAFKKNTSKAGWIAILITFVGAVIIAVGDSSGGSNNLSGDLYALTGAATIALCDIIGKRCRKNMSNTLYTMIVYWMTALVSLILLIVQGVPVLGYGNSNILCGFAMAIFSTLLGHSVFTWGLKYIEPQFISTAKLLEPVSASLLGIVFLSQIPSVTSVVGGVIIIAGIYYYMKQDE